MRTLPEALLAAQQYAPFAIPKIRVRLKNLRGELPWPRFTRYYTGDEPEANHAVAFAGDWSLLRVYVLPLYHAICISRVEDPGPESNYSSWAGLGASYQNVTICAREASVWVFGIELNAPYHIYSFESADYGQSFGAATDTGMVASDGAALAASMNAVLDICLFYNRGAVLYSNIRHLAAWLGESAASYTFATIYGIATTYWGDYNFVVTGTDASLKPTIWTGIFGDGYGALQWTWGPLKILEQRESSEPYYYKAPSVNIADVFRLTFAEVWTMPDTQNRVNTAHTLPTASWAANLWSEPIPFNYDSIQGLAVTHTATHLWLTCPSGVWAASYIEDTVDLSDHLLQIEVNENPFYYRSKLLLILDNTGGTYNDFAHLGYQIQIEWGYQTSEGPLYAPQIPFNITGWRFISPPWFPLRSFFPTGIVGTIRIEAEGVWDELKRWKARRTYSWASSERNVYGLLRFVFARVGREYSGLGGGSAALSAFRPEFEIRSGQSGHLAIKRLLAMVEDKILEREGRILSVYPVAGDSSVYTYNSNFGVAHLLYRGDYGVGAWDPNRAEVLGSTFNAWDYNFEQISQAGDRLSRIASDIYVDLGDAQDRVEVEMRRGKIWKANFGWVQVPVNCGQELWDVITITDSNAGVTAILRRVVGIKTMFNAKTQSYTQVLTLGAI